MNELMGFALQQIYTLLGVSSFLNADFVLYATVSVIK